MSVYITKLIKDTEAFIQAVLPVSIFEQRLSFLML